MEPFEIYSLVISIITYILLLSVGIFIIALVLKLSLKLIKSGAEDKEILKEYKKENAKKKNCALDCISSILMCIIFVGLFAFSIYVGFTTNNYYDNVPTLKVVSSSSMANKNEKNDYLFENNLNNQFNTFDLIAVYKAPKEEDIKLYDIVVYEIDGYLVIHRVVGIEEPNERHPNERWFSLQGDAISQTDRFPVKYSQIKAIYKNEKVPFVGSFIMFMQSPLGYISIILVVIAMIATPILENKIKKAKNERLEILFTRDGIVKVDSEDECDKLMESIQDVKHNYAQLLDALIFEHREETENNGDSEEIAATVIDESLDIKKRDFRTFAQKLEQAKDEVKQRYAPIYSLLSRIEGAKVIESKKQRTFKKGNRPIARLLFKGKTLCVLLALDTNEYKESKYVFTDLSSVKAHEDYPLCMRLTSTRQAKWSVELLEEIIARNGYKLSEIPVVEVEQKEEEVAPTVNEEIIQQEFVHPEEIIQQGGFNIEKKDFRTFAQKLDQAKEEVKERYAPIYSLLSRIEGAKVLESKKQRTFKKGNNPIARFIFKGKTLCVLFALDTNEYKESKYAYTDLSSVKAHEDYPLCMRLTSSRQSKWSVELLEELINKNGYELSPVPFDLIALKKFSGKKLSFTQRLRRLSGEVKERYKTVVEYLNSINGIKEFDSKQSKTFRQKGKPIAKITIKGKTVNVYLPLNPVDYAQSKYVFLDASSVKKYAKYPMRLKLTSIRQTKWTKELIDEVCVKYEKEKGE